MPQHDERSRTVRGRRLRTRAILLGSVVAAGITMSLVPGVGHTAPHGCASVSNDYNLHVDVARRSLGLQVYRNQPCSFYFSPGDTFSGSGEYIIRCATGGVFNDSLAMGPQINQPIPQPCAPGALVTINANQPWQGGAVVAGSPV